MVVKTWIRIEIGYESSYREGCTSKPPMQTVLEGHFAASDLERWSLGDSTDIGTAPFSDDGWVPLVIDKELNDALTSNNGGSVVVGAQVQFFPGIGQGTRCRIDFQRWINSATYELVDDKDEPWPADRDPSDARTFATVTWLCWEPT